MYHAFRRDKVFLIYDVCYGWNLNPQNFWFLWCAILLFVNIQLKKKNQCRHHAGLTRTKIKTEEQILTFFDHIFIGWNINHAVALSSTVSSSSLKT